MIPRYSTPEMTQVWADTTRIARWLEVELLATDAHAAEGIVPTEAAAACRERAPAVDDAFVRQSVPVTARVSLIYKPEGGSGGPGSLVAPFEGNVVVIEQAASLVARAIIATGRTLFISGQIPFDPVVGGIVRGTIAEQTTIVLTNLERVVRTAGATLAQVVQCRVYLADLTKENFAEMNGVYAGFFGDHKPARTTLGAQLPVQRATALQHLASTLQRSVDALGVGSVRLLAQRVLLLHRRKLLALGDQARVELRYGQLSEQLPLGHLVPRAHLHIHDRAGDCRLHGAQPLGRA